MKKIFVLVAAIVIIALLMPMIAAAEAQITFRRDGEEITMSMKEMMDMVVFDGKKFDFQDPGQKRSGHVLLYSHQKY